MLFVFPWLLLLCLSDYGNSKNIELGNKNYTVIFNVRSVPDDQRNQITCSLQNHMISWYFTELNSNKPYQLYPFEICNGNSGCDLENNNRTLVINKFTQSSEGNYICVDGEDGEGFTLSLEGCRTPSVEPYSFHNQTGRIGENVTFTCQVLIGRTYSCLNDAVIFFTSNIEEHRTTRITFDRKEIGSGIIRSVNYTIFNIEEQDFNKDIECFIYDEDGEETNLKARLLKKDAPIIAKATPYVRIIVPVLITCSIVLILLVIGIWIFQPRIVYNIMFYRNRLPDNENKEFHGLILYDDTGGIEIYEKVVKLKTALPRYKLREFPPGPESGNDPTAGYANFELLDSIVQECACVVIIGEAGEIGERCLSEYKGKHVTNILLSVSKEKKINPVHWPDSTSKCAIFNRIKWDNFLYEIRKGLPKPDTDISWSEYMVPEDHQLKTVDIERISLTENTANGKNY